MEAPVSDSLMHCDIFCLTLLIFEPLDVIVRYMKTVAMCRISYDTLQSNVSAVFPSVFGRE